MNHTLRILRVARALLGAGLAASGCRGPADMQGPGAAPEPDAGARGGLGEHGYYTFELTLEPSQPAVGQLFQVVTTVHDAGTGEPVEGASFRLDATMPEHSHGMTSAPGFCELGGGKYLAEGMKLHMPGRWVFEAHVEHDAQDRFVMAFDQRPTAVQ